MVAILQIRKVTILIFHTINFAWIKKNLFPCQQMSTEKYLDDFFLYLCFSSESQNAREWV